MNEWNVVLVLVTLSGLIGVFVKAAISLNTNSVRLTEAVKGLWKAVDSLKTESDCIDDRIDDHEHRITVLEERK
jgi:hypothetical protein